MCIMSVMLYYKQSLNLQNNSFWHQFANKAVLTNGTILHPVSLNTTKSSRNVSLPDILPCSLGTVVSNNFRGGRFFDIKSLLDTFSFLLLLTPSSSESGVSMSPLFFDSGFAILRRHLKSFADEVPELCTAFSEGLSILEIVSF